MRIACLDRMSSRGWSCKGSASLPCIDFDRIRPPNSTRQSDRPLDQRLRSEQTPQPTTPDVSLSSLSPAFSSELPSCHFCDPWLSCLSLVSSSSFLFLTLLDDDFGPLFWR